MKYIPTSAYELFFPPEWEGLDYASAIEATPKLYGVSFGDGNDGVSHTFAAYYVRTYDPYTLASAAMLGRFKSGFMRQACDELDIDGEAEYTISATLYEPLDREDPTPANHCNACDHDWTGDDSDTCPECDSDDINEGEPEESSYCDANGAWLICEVFPEPEPREGCPIYDSLEDCFGDTAPELAMARED
jgi:hypothetical protein